MLSIDNNNVRFTVDLKYLLWNYVCINSYVNSVGNKKKTLLNINKICITILSNTHI
jgi:hypothetical protein